MIRSAFAKKIVFRKKGDASEPEPTEAARESEIENKHLSIEENLNNNNSETYALSEVTEDLTENVEMALEMTEEVNEAAMNGENETSIIEEVKNGSDDDVKSTDSGLGPDENISEYVLPYKLNVFDNRKENSLNQLQSSLYSRMSV